MTDTYIVCNVHKTVFLADPNHADCDRYGTSVALNTARTFNTESEARSAKTQYNMRMRRRGRAPLHMHVYGVTLRDGMVPRLEQVVNVSCC